ncbi:hypothetical protein evm_014131, partial [Chilo suppressalis]
MPHSCVFGCNNPGVLHRFPKPDNYPERFKTWAAIVGKEIGMLSVNEVYELKRICDIHFLPEHKTRYNRLSNIAVPLLHLPGSGNNRDIAVATPPSFGSEPASGRVPAGSMPQSLDVIPQSPNIWCEQPSTSTSTAAISNADDREIGAKASASIVLQDHNYFVKRPKHCSLKKTIRQGGICQQKLRNLRDTISQLRRKSRTYKERLASATKLSDNVAFNFVTKHMTKAAKIFTHMQLQTKKKSKGRRFTIEQKVLSLSLYKKSPKCYRLLSSYFTLPSSKTMKQLLNQIKIGPGINPIIFQKLKNTLEGKDEADRLCSVIFDEMSLTPFVSYNARKDSFEGFATNKDNLFSNHVLVFMVKGIKRNFKQPLAYYYTNSLQKNELKNIIKDMISHIMQTGLIVVNTVCDQSTVNVGAITELINETKALFLRKNKEWRHEIFRVCGKNIIPLYDTPHLIKGLRNNLITKDLTYTSNDAKKRIKWEYYQMVYAADKSLGELRLLHKITEEHIVPEKINKMRVKLATQLFSHSVAVVTEHLTTRGDLPEECKHLIDLTILINNLFDSLNISNLFIPDGKIYKGPIKHNSPHHQLWQKAKTILKTVRFVKKNGSTETEIIVPSVINLIKTIEGMENVWKLLFKRYKLDAMLTRNFNQDPIENFFGNIRSFSGRNVSPNTVAFEGAYKALLLNGFSAPHSRRANCEADNNECLETLDFFLRGEFVNPDVPNNSQMEVKINFNEDVGTSLDSDAGQGNYVCGWVLKRCFKCIVKVCKDCREELIDNRSQNVNNNAYLQRKEYFVNKKWLCYPNIIIEKYFKDIQSIAVSCLKKNVPKTNVKGTIISLVEIFTESPFKCDTHKRKLRDFFVDTTLNVLIYSW